MYQGTWTGVVIKILNVTNHRIPMINSIIVNARKWQPIESQKPITFCILYVLHYRRCRYNNVPTIWERLQVQSREEKQWIKCQPTVRILLFAASYKNSSVTACTYLCYVIIIIFFLHDRNITLSKTEFLLLITYRYCEYTPS